jgi:hypothetical protein
MSSFDKITCDTVFLTRLEWTTKILVRMYCHFLNRILSAFDRTVPQRVLLFITPFCKSKDAFLNLE